jgi:hypothetical protein
MLKSSSTNQRLGPITTLFESQEKPGNDGSEVRMRNEEAQKIHSEGFSTDRETSPIGREEEIKAIQRCSTGSGSGLSVERRIQKRSEDFSTGRGSMPIGREKNPEEVRRLLYR